MPPAKPDIRIQAPEIEAAAELARISNVDGAGAVVTFTGICRSEDGRLAALELEHYPGMAETEIGRIADEAMQRWPVLALTAIHRIGKVRPGETIVLVAAASAHRQAAFSAAEFLMDYLKSHAPFWKKEHLADGTQGGWVEARDSDAAALDKWRR